MIESHNTHKPRECLDLEASPLSAPSWLTTIDWLERVLLLWLIITHSICCGLAVPKCDPPRPNIRKQGSENLSSIMKCSKVRRCSRLGLFRPIRVDFFEMFKFVFYCKSSTMILIYIRPQVIVISQISFEWRYIKLFGMVL